MEEYYFYTEGLTVGYHGVPLIKNIKISLKKGEILTLIGPNGAGKTTATPMSRTRVLLYQSPEQSVEQMLALQAERNSAIRFFVIGEK